MVWTKIIYMLIVVLIYVPMVFLGANVFFQEYTGTQSYYQWKECPGYTKVDSGEYAINQKCQDENRDAEIAWEKQKNAYEGQKYLFIVLFNLLILLAALLIPQLQDSVMMGLFLGSILATFVGTMIYFQSKSIPGFIALVVTFLVAVFFINRKREEFFGNKKAKE